MICIQEKAVQVIKEELAEQGLNAVKIIIFGSRERGDFEPDSDWDFLVAVDKDVNHNEKRNIIIQLKRQMARLRIPNDIVINSFKQIQAQVLPNSY